jgi:hypothetical protein
MSLLTRLVSLQGSLELDASCCGLCLLPRMHALGGGGGVVEQLSISS